jgi:hypothetical protein
MLDPGLVTALIAYAIVNVGALVVIFVGEWTMGRR